VRSRGFAAAGRPRTGDLVRDELPAGRTLTAVAFWTTRVYAVNEFFYAGGMLFSGQFVPLELMPPVIQAIAQALPFQIMRYFPVQVILNQMPAQVILRNYGAGRGLVGCAVGAVPLVWRAG
jgi:ABC-type uncharacterized transport system permease subunit